MTSSRADTASAANGAAFNLASFWLLHVGMPLALFVSMVAAASIGGQIEWYVLESPTGIRESLTGLLVLTAAVLSFVAALRPQVRSDWRLRTWVLVYGLAMIYFCGEDLNWGQYYLGWEASDFFQRHNRELETNFHNISPWFNQKPRLLVELWFLIAGILVPLGWNLPRRLTRSFVPDVLWPDRRLVFVAALALFTKLPSLVRET